MQHILHMFCCLSLVLVVHMVLHNQGSVGRYLDLTWLELIVSLVLVQLQLQLLAISAPTQELKSTS